MNRDITKNIWLKIYIFNSVTLHILNYQTETEKKKKKKIYATESPKSGYCKIQYLTMSLLILFSGLTIKTRCIANVTNAHEKNEKKIC